MCCPADKEKETEITYRQTEKFFNNIDEKKMSRREMKMRKIEGHCEKE